MQPKSIELVKAYEPDSLTIQLWEQSLHCEGDACPALSIDFVRDPCHRVQRGVHDICGCFTISAIFFIVEFL